MTETLPSEKERERDRSSRTPHEAWNVQILCEDAETGVAARRLLDQALASQNLHATCHIRQWRFEEVRDVTVLEDAVEHALESDLVLVSAHGSCPLPDAVLDFCGGWVPRRAGAACPLVVLFEAGCTGDDASEQFTFSLRRLADRAHVPLYRSLSDAVLVVWDLWFWKQDLPALGPHGGQFPSARTELIPPARAAGESCLSSGRRHAGSGGTERYRRAAPHFQTSRIESNKL